MLTLIAALLSTTPPDTQVLSEALGHLIGKHLEELGLPLDPEKVAQGLQEEAAGKPGPMEEEDCLAKLSQLQKTIEQKKIEADLEQQRKKPGVVSLLEGKLLYRVMQRGEGNAVEVHHTPLIRMVREGKNGSEELIVLSEACVGLQQGIVGMKEGEIRVLHLHPDVGLGASLTVELLSIEGTGAPINSGLILDRARS